MDMYAPCPWSVSCDQRMLDVLTETHMFIGGEILGGFGQMIIRWDRRIKSQKSYLENANKI
jgi:hypothetical protein